MSPEDIKKLLGGYATGTLTEVEQQALFAAALEDQELFDALAGEQSLRDLLGDPAARAELLSALDTPSRLAGFWQWLRRPVVAGLATAGVATIAVVAVWQGTRLSPVKPAPVIVAELRDQTAPPPAQPPAEIPAPAREPEFARRAKVGNHAVKAPPPARMEDQAAPPPMVPPTPGMTALALRKDQPAIDAAEKKVSPQPPVPAAAPALMARKAKAEADATETRQAAATVSGSVKESVTVDARSLFYANPLAPGANAFVPGDKGAAAPPLPQVDAAPRTAKSIAGLAASVTATPARLGVRASILRGASEVDLTTVLDPGEAVRLKLTPNADGFLYVVEGARLLASGPAQRLKPFETPELRFQGGGPKQLYVMLSRSPWTVDPASLATMARGDLVETSASQDRATYVVSGQRDAAAQQVVVPVTLTWR